jgi:hypothetical protein
MLLRLDLVNESTETLSYLGSIDGQNGFGGFDPRIKVD